MEDTWVSSRGPCSSPSPSPGWTRWLWVTPMPYVSGRNRSPRARAHTWVRAPALRRKPKSLYPSPSVPPLSPSLPPPALRRHLEKTLNCSFFSAFSSGAIQWPHTSPCLPPQFSFVTTITLQYMMEQKQLTAFTLVSTCENYWNQSTIWWLTVVLAEWEMNSSRRFKESTSLE